MAENDQRPPPVAEAADIEDQVAVLKALIKIVEVQKDTLLGIATGLSGDSAEGGRILAEAADNLVQLHSLIETEAFRTRDRFNALKS